MFSYVFFYICLFVFWLGLFTYARNLIGWYDSQTNSLKQDQLNLDT